MANLPSKAAITPLDRLGRPLPPAENPDYRDTEEERGG